MEMCDLNDRIQDGSSENKQTKKPPLSYNTRKRQFDELRNKNQ